LLDEVLGDEVEEGVLGSGDRIGAGADALGLAPPPIAIQSQPPLAAFAFVPLLGRPPPTSFTATATATAAVALLGRALALQQPCLEKEKEEEEEEGEGSGHDVWVAEQGGGLCWIIIAAILHLALAARHLVSLASWCLQGPASGGEHPRTCAQTFGFPNVTHCTMKTSFFGVFFEFKLGWWRV